MYRSRRSEARIQQMIWKVDYSDIVFISTVSALCYILIDLRQISLTTVVTEIHYAWIMVMSKEKVTYLGLDAVHARRPCNWRNTRTKKRILLEMICYHKSANCRGKYQNNANWPSVKCHLCHCRRLHVARFSVQTIVVSEAFVASMDSQMQDWAVAEGFRNMSLDLVPTATCCMLCRFCHNMLQCAMPQYAMVCWDNTTSYAPTCIRGHNCIHSGILHS